MANYEQVLHLIRYKNWHTEALFDRKFKLVCSELNGRYISNDFKVEVRAACLQGVHWNRTRVYSSQSDPLTATLSLAVSRST